MRKKRRFLIISCVLCAMMAISFSAVGCSREKEPEPAPQPEPEASDAIPEGIVNFDETWLDE